ncbi:hypothetical protein V5O48_009256 [Marasmius crinis-equi]|uniref:BZIP domain-containing protein n=1 Tax=Marasmius crinis-equi TaxID=585013 RepID=A0ABR3FC87_9AGAR
MAPPTRYSTKADKKKAVCEKSARYYERNSEAIKARKRAKRAETKRQSLQNELQQPETETKRHSLQKELQQPESRSKAQSRNRRCRKHNKVLQPACLSRSSPAPMTPPLEQPALQALSLPAPALPFNDRVTAHDWSSCDWDSKTLKDELHWGTDCIWSMNLGPVVDSEDEAWYAERLHLATVIPEHG